MPATPRVPPAAPTHPGDIVQVTKAGHDAFCHIGIVAESHRWGVWTLDPKLRLRKGEFEVCGSAKLVPPEVAQAREASLATAALVAAEAKR